MESLTYEDVFSAEEWRALTGNRKVVDHTVTINYPPGDYAGNENRYELDCDSCGYIGAVDSLQCAEATARLHDEFVAVLVTDYEVPAGQGSALPTREIW